jgi:hypothetical protein
MGKVCRKEGGRHRTGLEGFGKVTGRHHEMNEEVEVHRRSISDKQEGMTKSRGPAPLNA